MKQTTEMALENKFFSLYKPPLQPAKSSHYSNRTNMLDRDGLRIFVVEHYLAEDNAKMELDTFICEAVNNYNAFKKQVETEAQYSSLLKDENEHLKQANEWMKVALEEAVNHSHVYDTNPALIELFQTALQKAKQL